MVAIATPVAQVADLATCSPTAQAAALGYPKTLFGSAPTDRAYWFEPGLAWLTADQMYPDKMPLGYSGYHDILCVAYLSGDQMAPRFPNGCGVHTTPVIEKKNLVVGRVYTYGYLNEESGEREYEMGRLVKIGGNYLEVKADNRSIPSIWLLREEPGEELWDVREVTHYASYPAQA